MTSRGSISTQSWKFSARFSGGFVQQAPQLWQSRGTGAAEASARPSPAPCLNVALAGASLPDYARSMWSPAWRTTALAACVLALACSSGPAARGQPALAAEQGAKPEPGSPVASGAAPRVYNPSVPSATVYGGPSTPPLNADPLARAIRQALVKRVREAGLPPPQADGRIDRAAAELAAWQGPLGHELVNFIWHHVGLPEPQPGVTSLRTNAADAEVVGQVLQHTEEALAHGAWARMGVGVARGRDDVGVVILLGSVDVALEPLPRRLPAGGSAAVKGEVPSNYRKPEIVVTTPKGQIGRLPSEGAGARFSGTFSCLQGDGRYDVEVLATGPKGPEVMVNVPVYCNQPVPARFEPTSAAETAFGTAHTPEAVERAMVEAINRARRARGLSALREDARLVRLARAHSRDMAANRTISHLSSKGEDAQVRVLAAGLAPRLVAENVGTATTAAAVHEGFMGSPGHRANVLKPQATHVGVGVVLGPAPNGMDVWYVTELFAAFPAAKR